MGIDGGADFTAESGKTLRVETNAKATVNGEEKHLTFNNVFVVKSDPAQSDDGAE